jgi:Tol biopolymer transport system component
MSSTKKILLALTVLLLAAMACDWLPSPEPTLSQGDVIATSVAKTVAAGEEEEPEAPTLTPEPPPLLRIVYVKDGDVWYWEEGGPHLVLTALGDIVSAYLSSDGQLVAFVRQHDWNNDEIYIINTDGSNIHPLVSLADFAIMVSLPDAISAVPYRIAWVPGTHLLAFNTRMTFEGPGLILPDELRLADADTTTLSVLMPQGTAGDFYYSPDGSQIALVNATSISVVDADGSNRRDLLTFPYVITYSEYMYYPPVVWSPDGTVIGAAIPASDPLLDPPDPTAIWYLPADGSPGTMLSTIASVPFFHNAAIISPDISKVAYLSMVTPGSPPIVDLHIVNMDGSGDLIYSSGDRQFNSWSTDGEHFIFSESGYNPKIGRVGSPPLDLIGITRLLNSRWVDETRFLYLNLLSGSWELWLREIGTPGSIIASTTGESIAFDFIY